jgi:DNA-binding NarL/FixJ family response regulator
MPSRILVVDDYEYWRRRVCSILKQERGWQVIAEAADGTEAVQKAEELQPDLILLDIGLPKRNGIEAARLIRRLAPNATIIFLSQESSADVVEEALSTGASGYVVKSDASAELLAAVEASMRCKKFVSTRPGRYDFTPATDAQESVHPQRTPINPPPA